MGFYIASDEDIRAGKVTDVYFRRVIAALEKRSINPVVNMEVRAGGLPGDWRWAVFAGLEEVLELVDGLPVELRSIDEGTLFSADEPVLSIKGRYLDFAVYETALLGLICQASGIATTSARCRLAAGERTVISFGARRMHPAIAPMIERNAYLGGCDGVAVVQSAELIGLKPSGTMAHSLILCAGDEKIALEAFEESLEPGVPLIALIDTFQDEKFGALFAAEVLGDRLSGVRLDTPGSRRGDFKKIMQEVRWELDVRGFGDVKLFVSGNLDEYNILEYNGVADAYGVGTHISNSPVVNFSADIVEVDGELRSKRGKKAGLKQLWTCPECDFRSVTLADVELASCPAGGELMEPLIKDQYADGRRLRAARSISEMRASVVESLGSVELD
jgi:nicotinate phosphoribosyltransferase